MLKQYAIYTLTSNQEMVLSNCRIPLVPGLRAPPVNLCSREDAWQEGCIPEHLHPETRWKVLWLPWLGQLGFLWKGKGLCFMALTPSPGCLSWDTATTHRHRDREHSVPLEILPLHACSLNKYVCSKRIYMPKHTSYSWKQVSWFCCDSKLPRAVKRGNIPFSCKREMCMVWAKWRLKTKYQLNSNWHSSQRNQFHLKSFSTKTDQLS